MKSVIICIIVATSASAQTYHVPLEVRPSEMQGMFYGIEIRPDDETHLHAALPGGSEFRMVRMAEPLNGVIVHIPGGEPATIALLPDQRSEIMLNRTVGQAKAVPYVLEYIRNLHDGQLQEMLAWIPSYRAEGKLKLPGCDVNIGILDLNGDGVFDRKDSLRGTTLGLDLNNDRRFWGGGEWRRMEEIIEVCGSPLEVAELDPNGLSITFRVSELKTPVINGPLPQFSVPTAAGGVLRTSDFRGKIHVLNFWASWCGPCVAELNKLDAFAREHTHDVKVYGIDVDEPERRADADRILKEKALSFPQVIREQGEKDFLWKMFGSMAGVRLSIPLFVVIDGGGVIRYAGSGGDGLAEVKQTVTRLMSP